MKLLVIFLLVAFIYSEDICQPFGIRLSLGRFYTLANDEDDMINIVFNTQSECSQSHVVIDGIKYLAKESNEIDMAEIYKDFEPAMSFQTKYDYTYRTFVQLIQIGNLTPGSSYKYSVYGYNEGFPSESQFKLPQKVDSKSTSVILFGDMAQGSVSTLEWFRQQAQQNQSAYDCLIYTGDMAYDLESDDGQRGDQYLREISESFTSYWPFMPTPGNHDAGNNTHFPIYRKSFSTPVVNSIDTPDAYLNYYSYNLGLIHFISFNPYNLIYNKQGNEDSIKELKNILGQRLEEDLKSLDRYQTPWVLIYTHYPIYCSDKTDTACTKNIDIFDDFVELMEEHNVQFYVSGHSHVYERRSHQVNETQGPNEVFLDGGHPIYIVEGVGGIIKEEIKEISKSDDSLFLTQEYSVGVLTIHNQTHALLEQVSTLNGSIIDTLNIVQMINLPPIHKQRSKVWQFTLILLSIVIGLAVLLGIYKKFKQNRGDRQHIVPLNHNEYELT